MRDRSWRSTSAAGWRAIHHVGLLGSTSRETDEGYGGGGGGKGRIRLNWCKTCLASYPASTVKTSGEVSQGEVTLK